MNEVDTSVWTIFISARAARKVAAALKAAGYGTATRENCRGYVINIARYFEPGDVEEYRKLCRKITEAAGLQPAKEIKMATLQNVGEIKTHNLDKNSEKECDFCNNKATQYSQYEFRDAAGSKVVYHCRSCRKVAIENLSGL